MLNSAKNVCIHAAGHAVAAANLRISFSRMWLTADREGWHVECSIAAKKKNARKIMTSDALTATFAGPAAQRLFSPESTEYQIDDERRASWIVDSICKIPPRDQAIFLTFFRSEAKKLVEIPRIKFAIGTVAKELLAGKTVSVRRVKTICRACTELERLFTTELQRRAAGRIATTKIPPLKEARTILGLVRWVVKY
jgi:hypothetical protein